MSSLFANCEASIENQTPRPRERFTSSSNGFAKRCLSWVVSQVWSLLCLLFLQIMLSLPSRKVWNPDTNTYRSWDTQSNRRSVKAHSNTLHSENPIPEWLARPEEAPQYWVSLSLIHISRWCCFCALFLESMLEFVNFYVILCWGPFLVGLFCSKQY